MHDHATQDVSSLWIFAVLGLFGVLYLMAVVQQYRQSRPWSVWRSGAFMLGIGLIAVAFLPAVQQQAHHNLSAHMSQHLLIGMFAPIALVLAKPVSLFLRSMPVNAARGVVAVFNSPPCTWLVNPWVTLVLNIGGMYALYLTPLYTLSLNHAVVHYWVHCHFLLAGYLFVWSLIQADPLPHRPSTQCRIVILLISLAAHGLLAKLIYAQIVVIEPPFAPADIETAAILMYYGGDLAEAIIAVLLFSEFYRVRQNS